MVPEAIEASLAPMREEMTKQHSLLTAYRLHLDTLTARVEEQERSEGSSTDLAALWTDIVELRRDMDELNSTDISTSWGGVDAPKVPRSDLPSVIGHVEPAFWASSKVSLASMTRVVDDITADDESEPIEMD